MFDLRNELNQAQLEAVTTINGPVLVIAGAGSGKTRVIEYRVLHLVKNKISPHSILLLTFTRKAAKNMLARAAGHDPRCQNVEGGTFHSFGYRNLRKYAKDIGFPNSFSILDEGDAEEAIHRCCNRLGFFEKQKRFPKKDTLKNIISMSINQNVSIENVLNKEYPHFLEYASDIKTLREKYAEYKILRNYLDYDDLLVYLKLLLNNQGMRERISQQYQYIMVDEYQDTNKLQGDIVYLLGMKHKNVMVVGDDAQSIYGFRGAFHENIMKFPEQFSECKTIKLEKNYRSTQSVLDVANAVLENMKNKYPKCLVSARGEVGHKPILNSFRNAYEEAECMAEKIKKLSNEGITLSQIGVLYRSSYLSIPLQAELAKRNIPYQVFGGLRFHELAHVKDMLAHLKILINPKDELAWNRVLMLIEGIGPKTSERILEEILVYSGFNEILINAFQKYQKGSKYFEELDRLKSALKTTYDDKLNVGEQFKIILDYYTPILKNKFDDWHRRFNDLEALRQIFMRYDSLEEVLADLAIEPPEKGVREVDPSVPDDEKPLTLSTIHSAKGLEWTVVFLIGLADGCLPVSFALDDENEIEEEHRLFYVAITRAKNYLFLSLHNEGVKGGMYQLNKISRFVDVSNVLSKLEQTVILQPQIKQAPSYQKHAEVTPVYNKKSLLETIIDLFK